MKVQRKHAMLLSALLMSAASVVSVAQGHADDVAPPRGPTTTAPARVAPPTTPTTNPARATTQTTTTTTVPRAVQSPQTGQEVPPSLPPDPDPNPDIPYPCPQDPICDWGTLPPLPKTPPSLPPDTTLVIGDPCEWSPDMCGPPSIPDLPIPDEAPPAPDTKDVTAAVHAARAILERFVTTFAPTHPKADANGCAWIYIPFAGWQYYCPPSSPPSGSGGAGDGARSRDFIDLA